MIKTFFIFSFILITLSGFGQRPEIKFTEYDLPNGLHVILHEDHSTPIVAVSVMYHVGSKNEDPDRTGFAHFFEHLMFEGSENIDRGKFSEYVENAGGDLNANTSQDRTYYYEILPSNQLALGLWLESERMLHAKVDQKGVETQRSVVKEERRQRVDNQPYGSIMEQTFKRAFKEHPYKWSVIGSMDHLNAAEVQDYVNFYNTFYVPNNAVLSIAGDLNTEETKKLIKKYFGDIPRGENPIPTPKVTEPPLGGEIRDTVYDNIQLPAVIEAYRIPEQGSDDFYIMQMLTTLLSSGKSSRLHKRLVEDEQSALFVGTFPLPLEDPGLSMVFSIAGMGVDPKDVEDAIDDEFRKIKNEKIPEEEMTKLRNQVENNYINRFTTMAGIAENLANYYMYYGNTNLINTEIDKYMKVTPEDIREVAKKYLVKENKVVLYYLPVNESSN